MMREQDVGNFYNEMLEARGKYNNTDVEGVFIEITRDLFSQLGIELKRSEYQTASFDFTIINTGEFLEEKQSSNSNFSISDKEWIKMDYFFGFIRNHSSNYKDFTYVFLTKEELENIKNIDYSEDYKRKMYIVKNNSLTFDEVVLKIKKEFDAAYEISVNEDSFYENYKDAIIDAIDKSGDWKRIGRLSELFMMKILENNGRIYIDMNDIDSADELKLKRLGFDLDEIVRNGNNGVFDILDVTNENKPIRIEMKGTTAFWFKTEIDKNNFDILVCFFAHDNEVRYIMKRNDNNGSVRKASFTFGYAKPFDETTFVDEYLKAIE